MADISKKTAVTKSKLNQIYTDVRFCVTDLKQGFDVSNDLSHCSIGHLNVMGLYKKISDYLMFSKAGRIIRVTGRGRTLFKQALACAEKFKGYKAIYVNSLQEAEKELIQPIKPNALRFQIYQCKKLFD